MDPVQSAVTAFLSAVQAAQPLPDLPVAPQAVLAALLGQDVSLMFQGKTEAGLQFTLPSGQTVTAQGDFPYPEGTQLLVRVAPAAAGGVRLQTLQAQPPAPAAILAPLLQGEAQALQARLTQPDPPPGLEPLVQLFRLLGGALPAEAAVPAAPEGQAPPASQPAPAPQAVPASQPAPAPQTAAAPQAAPVPQPAPQAAPVPQPAPPSQAAPAPQADPASLPAPAPQTAPAPQAAPVSQAAPASQAPPGSQPVPAPATAPAPQAAPAPPAPQAASAPPATVAPSPDAPALQDLVDLVQARLPQGVSPEALRAVLRELPEPQAQALRTLLRTGGAPDPAPAQEAVARVQAGLARRADLPQGQGDAVVQVLRGLLRGADAAAARTAPEPAAAPETWQSWIREGVKALSDPAVSPREAPFHAAQAKEGTAFYELPLPWAPQAPLQLWVESDAGGKARQGREGGETRVLLGLTFTQLGETRLGIAKGPGGLRVRVWAQRPAALQAAQGGMEAELGALGLPVDLRIMALEEGPVPSLRSLATGSTLQVLG